MTSNAILFRRLAVTFGFALVAGVASASTPTPVVYRISPRLSGGEVSAVRVSISFRAPKTGAVVLQLPENGTGNGRYPGVQGWTVTGAQQSEAPGTGRREIKATPKSLVRIDYEFSRNVPAGHFLPNPGNYSNPAIGGDWFYFSGTTGIVAIGGLGETRDRVVWDLPKGWRAVKPPRGGDVASPTRSVYLAGRGVREQSIRAGGTKIAFASLGLEPDTEAMVVRALRATARAEGGFWQTSDPPYLVTMVASDPSSGGGPFFRGTRVPGGIMMTSAGRIDEAQLTALIGHEYFHRWNHDRLVRPPEGEDERLYYWFSEGFTDFYARKILLQCAVISPAAFASQWNAILRAYAVSKFRQSPNNLAARLFSSDPQARQLPYQRGALVAALLDMDLTARGSSLDDAMRTLLKAAPKTNVRASGAGVAEQLIAAIGPGQAESAAALDRFIERGEFVTLPPGAFGPDFEVVTETVPVRDLGYDVEASRKAGVFVGVDVEGPAYRAGLRNGFKRVLGEGENALDSQQSVTWRYRDEQGVERVVAFKPEGRLRLNRQRIAFVGKSLRPAESWCQRTKAR